MKHTSFDLPSDLLFCSFISLFVCKHCCLTTTASNMCCLLLGSCCLFFLLEFPYFLVTVGTSSSWRAETMAHLLGLCSAGFRTLAPRCGYSEGSNWARSRAPGAQVPEEKDAGRAWGAVLPSGAASGPRADHGPFPFFPRLETCDLSVMELVRQNSGWVFENPCKEDATVGAGSISLPALGRSSGPSVLLSLPRPPAGWVQCWLGRGGPHPEPSA